jgi:hypothetical protein
LIAPPEQDESMKTMRTEAPWLQRLHLALTLALLAGLVGLAGLAAAGRIHVGRPAAAEPPKEAESPTSPPDAGAGGGGRYRIEAMEEAGQAVHEAAQMELLGERTAGVWVYRYQGGYLACRLECRLGDERVTVGPVPRDWKEQLAREAASDASPEGALRQGFIVLAALDTPLTPAELVQPFLPHLGGLVQPPAAGVLSPLPLLAVPTRQPREFRLFLSAGPPRTRPGTGFRYQLKTHLPLHFPLLPTPQPERAATGGGNDLEPGRDVGLLLQERGRNRIELKARFLTDAELARARGK